MKSLKASILVAAVTALIAGTPAAIGSAPLRVGSYDFSYLTSGEGRATPVQVFDDGKNTYFQFRAGDAIPAIFVLREGQPGLVTPSFEGPYVKVGEVAGRFTLQLGRAQAHVVFAGPGRDGVPPIQAVDPIGMTTAYKGTGYPADPNVKLVASLGPAMSFIANDALESNSYATPVKGDKVTWKDGETKTAEHQIWFTRGGYAIKAPDMKQITGILPALKAATRITVVGRDDDSFKEGLEVARGKAIKDALIKAGVPAEKIIVKSGVQGEPKKGLWASDIRIETVAPTLIARPNEPKPVTGAVTAAPERTADSRANIAKANTEELVKAGVITKEQAQAILRRAPEPVMAEAPADGFNLKASDRTVAGTMRRWAAATNYQVVWDAPQTSDAPITGDAPIKVSTMKEAVEKVVIGLQKSGYDIQATMYSNRVIRFTGSSK